MCYFCSLYINVYLRQAYSGLKYLSKKMIPFINLQ